MPSVCGCLLPLPCLDLEPSLLIGDSWSITWQLRTNSSYRAKLEEKLFSDRHLRHGEDSKEVLLGQEEERAWQLWKEKVKHFKKRRQQGAAPISKKKSSTTASVKEIFTEASYAFECFGLNAKKKAISMFTKK